MAALQDKAEGWLEPIVSNADVADDTCGDDMRRYKLFGLTTPVEALAEQMKAGPVLIQQALSAMISAVSIEP